MIEEIKQQFIEYIMLQVYDDQYIDRQEEKSILEEGIKKGFTVTEGMAIIKQLATNKDLVIEREVEEQVKDVVEQFALNDGVVDKKEFSQALLLFKKACKGRVPEIELKRRLKKIILYNEWKVKEGGLFGSKWFSEIELQN
ncbi:MAG: hypothetical protein KAH84_03335 [Thiomargarita sp.]|nr:hypothetical protein [Thiomargarita sp.]